MGAALIGYTLNLLGHAKGYDSTLTITMFVTGATLLGLTTGDKHP